MIIISDKNVGIDSWDYTEPDSAFSLESEEFKAMVKSVREVEKALGEVSYDLTEKMKKSRELSRSLFVVKDIKAGEVFNKENVRSIRPGYGLLPKYLKDVLGKKASHAIKKGTPLVWELVTELGEQYKNTNKLNYF